MTDTKTPATPAASNGVKTCQITCSDDGKNCLGVAQYWKCGKPAKAIIFSELWKKDLPICGIHARAHDRVAKKYCFQLSRPISHLKPVADDATLTQSARITNGGVL